jgi:hypothetical protein
MSGMGDTYRLVENTACTVYCLQLKVSTQMTNRYGHRGSFCELSSVTLAFGLALALVMAQESAGSTHALASIARPYLTRKPRRTPEYDTSQFPEYCNLGIINV